LTRLILRGDEQADRSAPILDHRRERRQSQRIDEPADHPRVLFGEKPVPRRRRRETEPGQIRRDAAKAVAKERDHVTEEETPGRIAVHH
jgi:hypothetical protein